MSISIVKDYWNRRPCNIRHSKKEIGTIEYFNEVEKKKYFVEPHIPLFAEFEKWKGKKVLELGTGIGTDTINFLRNGATVTGIDISDKSIDICHSRAKVFGLDSNLTLHEGNIENLEDIIGESEKFDLIYSFGVIHHTPDPRKAVDSLAKFLKADGEIRVMLYSKYSFKLLNKMHESTWDFAISDDIIKYYAEAQEGCPYAYTYSFREVKELFNKYTILDIAKTHIFKYKIPEYIEGKYVVLDCLKNMSESKFKELEEELGWHTLIRARLKV